MTGIASTIRRAALTAALLGGIGLLSACESSEERAEKHFQAGMELLEQGDVDRALVEFRNVFKLNGEHKDARIAYARAELGRGNTAAAYSQYLRLVEQYPENLEGRRALAQIALDTGNWEEVARHAPKALELAPEDPMVQSINNALSYFNAIQDRDERARRAAVERARGFLAEDPAMFSARKVVIDDLIRKQDWTAALEQIDAGLAASPDLDTLYPLRLGVLNELGDTAALEDQLRKMIERFPEEDIYKDSLAQLYISGGNIDAAEEFLRGLADPAADDLTPVYRLIAFLRDFRDTETAIAELGTYIEAGGPNTPLFRSLHAGMTFDEGKHEAAIAEMESILESAERTAQTRQIEIDLARMLFKTGNNVGARALVERVLEEDPTQIDGMKLKADWLIRDDKTGDAIVLLREALGEAPRDPDLMTLMAQAHERDGNRQLMSEMLSLAVEASGNAPGESLRYAGILVEEGKNTSAEAVLIDALRLAPNNLPLLSALGRLYVQMENWGRAENVIRVLNQSDDETARTIAKEITALKLAAQERDSELMSFLTELTEDPVLGQRADLAIIESYLARADAAGARQHLESLLEEDPKDPELRFILGSLMARSEEYDGAEAMFRGLLEDDLKDERAWSALYQVLRAQGAAEDAARVLEEALQQLPGSANLLWAKAGELESTGDVEGAIAIYEDLYEQNSSAPIVANNLASLLANYREDPESLSRAYSIARRLRGTDIAPFQDTYGWISYRLGNYEEALSHLEPAAEGLPEEPSVQYHLGKTYAALGRQVEALEALRRAADLTAQSTPPYAEDLAQEIARIERILSDPEKSE